MYGTGLLRKLFVCTVVGWRFHGAIVMADYDTIAGYTPVSDVVEHSEIDLDVQDMENGTDLLTDAGFSAAWTVYDLGGNSEKTDSIRNIRDFSTSAQEKLTGETWFDAYEAYWGDPAYADAFTSSACNGTGTFADVEPIVRAEGCIKGAQYQNIWMYVIHEMEDAINDCENGDLTANDGGPHAWDEAWAFYSGSLEGTDGSGDGYLLYALAEKRCENFATCTGDDDGDDLTGTSAVNADTLDLFKEGSVHLLSGECDEVSEIKDKIVDLMTVPLVQGLLRYLYLADPEGGNGGDKEAAELWSFSASLLPRLHECNSDMAIVIRDNTELGSTSAPVSDGFVAMKEELESVYDCLGISCNQVGGLVIGETSTYYDGMEPCSDGGSSDLPAYAIGIVSASVCAAGLLGVCMYKRFRKKRDTSPGGGDGGLGDFSVKPSTTV